MNKLKLSLPSFFRKEIFTKKWVRLLIKIIGAFLGLILVILILLLARLSWGPINLDSLTPEIEDAFKAPKVGLKASIEHTQLVWKAWSRPFEIELVNVRLQKDQNPEWLKIEHIGVSLRLYRLIGGDISLRQIRLYRPHILLEKNENGEFSLGFGETAPDQEFSFQDIAPFLALGEPNPALGKLNDLTQISIIDAQVLLKDEERSQAWELPKATFVLKRQVEGFRTELTFRSKQGSGSLKLGLAHRLGSSRFDIYADFRHISFKDLIDEERPTLSLSTSDAINFDTILNFLNHWNVPVHGNFHVALVPSTLQLIKGSCDLNFEQGELDLSLAKLLPLPIDSGNFSLEFSPNEIVVKDASLSSDKMYIDFSGKLASPLSPLLLTKFLGPGQSLEFHGEIKNLFFDHLGALWPQDLAPHPRKWLTENLRTGVLTEGTFSLSGHGEEKGFVLDELKGTLEGKEAEITYLEGLPPAEKVNAQATFDKNKFDIKILSGEVEHLQIQEGNAIISGLDNDKEALNLHVKVKGPLPDVLDIINHKPLEYASYGGIDPKKAKGDVNADLNISFPLLADLKFKDVKMAFKGALKNVALEREITEKLTAQLTQGNFSFDLNEDQMVIKGKGTLNQLPSNLIYTHYFTESSPYELQIQAETAASFEDFKRLGFDYLEYCKGPTRTKLTYLLERDKKSRFLIDLDTTPSTFSFPPLNWQKKPGEKSNLSFALIFKDGELSKIKDLRMSSPIYSLEGAILFGDQKNWKAILLSEFKGPHTHTQVTLHKLGGNAYELSFKGQSVDLEKYLEYIDHEESLKAQPPTDIKILADVNQLRLGEGKIFHNVKAEADLLLQGNETIWKAVSLRAKAGEGTAYKGDMARISGGILFDIKPGPNNTTKLEVRANDAGQFLKNLSIYDEIQGGYITVKAEREGQGPYKGVFKIKQFDVNKVPLLAQFAALLSPMGIVNLFSAKNTLSLDRFECNFEFDENLVAVQNGIGKSLALGFTVEGKLNRKDRLYTLKGNIIPARFLNSILNNIPIIGSLLNGGEGEGLFAIAYSVKGSFEDPQISLNPLSALAPGFLRKIFQSLGGDKE